MLNTISGWIFFISIGTLMFIILWKLADFIKEKRKIEEKRKAFFMNKHLSPAPSRPFDSHHRHYSGGGSSNPHNCEGRLPQEFF